MHCSQPGGVPRDPSPPPEQSEGDMEEGSEGEESVGSDRRTNKKPKRSSGSGRGRSLPPASGAHEKKKAKRATSAGAKKKAKKDVGAKAANPFDHSPPVGQSKLDGFMSRRGLASKMAATPPRRGVAFTEESPADGGDHVVLSPAELEILEKKVQEIMKEHLVFGGTIHNNVIK